MYQMYDFYVTDMGLDSFRDVIWSFFMKGETIIPGGTFFEEKSCINCSFITFYINGYPDVDPVELFKLRIFKKSHHPINLEGTKASIFPVIFGLLKEAVEIHEKALSVNPITNQKYLHAWFDRVASGRAILSHGSSWGIDFARGYKYEP